MSPTNHREKTRRSPRGLIVLSASVVLALGFVGVGAITGFGPISEASATVRSFGGHHRYAPQGWRHNRSPKPAPPTASAPVTPGRPSTTPPQTPVKPTPSATNAAVVNEVVSLVNVERAKAGCQALTANAALNNAAHGHSADMAARNYFSHDTLGGGSFADRITAAGYKWSGAAENIASGQRTPASVMESWMNSSGHRANILNCGYRDIGVGVAANASGSLYWTQDFASPR